MLHKQEDLRVKRTRRLIQNALIELVAEKGFEAATVGDIAARALINRSTFYRHYEDKYDLMAQIFKDVVVQMAGEIGLPMNDLISVDQAEAPKSWIKFFGHLSEHAKMYRAMLGPNGSPWFTFKMRDCLSDIVRQRIHAYGSGKTSGSVPEEAVAAFISNCCVGVIAWWLNSKNPAPPEQIAQWLSGFLLHGYFHTAGLRFPPAPT